MLPLPPTFASLPSLLSPSLLSPLPLPALPSLPGLSPSLSPTFSLPSLSPGTTFTPPLPPASLPLAFPLRLRRTAITLPSSLAIRSMLAMMPSASTARRRVALILGRTFFSWSNQLPSATAVIPWRHNLPLRSTLFSGRYYIPLRSAIFSGGGQDFASIPRSMRSAVHLALPLPLTLTLASRPLLHSGLANINSTSTPCQHRRVRRSRSSSRGSPSRPPLLPGEVTLHIQNPSPLIPRLIAPRGTSRRARSGCRLRSHSLQPIRVDTRHFRLRALSLLLLLLRRRRHLAGVHRRSGRGGLWLLRRAACERGGSPIAGSLRDYRFRRIQSSMVFGGIETAMIRILLVSRSRRRLSLWRRCRRCK
jgi:hypothetical protein